MATKSFTYTNGQTADGGQIETDMTEIYTNIDWTNFSSSNAMLNIDQNFRWDNTYGVQFENAAGSADFWMYEDANDNIVTKFGSTIVEIYVPTTGDIQQAITDANGTALVRLGPGTHTPSDQININVAGTTIVGAGRGVTIVSGSSNNTGSNEAVLSTTKDDCSIHRMTVTIAGTASTFGVEVDLGSANVNDFMLSDVEITGADTSKVGLTFRGANSSFNSNVRNVKITGTGTGTGLNIDNTSRSFFTGVLIDVDTGTHWDIDASSDYNLCEFIVRTAGTNNGTGNSVTEVVY